MCEYSYLYKRETKKDGDFYMIRLACGQPLIFTDEEISDAYMRAVDRADLQIHEDDFRQPRSQKLTFIIALIIGFIAGTLIF
jgi:hypothetical protein